MIAFEAEDGTLEFARTLLEGVLEVEIRGSGTDLTYTMSVCTQAPLNSDTDKSSVWSWSSTT